MNRYEFSYRDKQGDMHFVTTYDDSIVSACERILFRPVDVNEIIPSKQPNNHFVKGWEEWETTMFTINVQPVQASSHVIFNPSSQQVAKAEKLIEELGLD